MSYLKVTHACNCEEYVVPLQAISEVTVPRSSKDLSVSDKAPEGEYLITINYLKDDSYTMKFCKNCWHEVENVVDQLQQVVRGPLIKSIA